MNSLLKILIIYLISFSIIIFTNPGNLPLILLILPLLVLYIALTLTLSMIIKYMYREKYDNFPQRTYTFIAAIIAGFPITCILLKSIGQFSAGGLLILGSIFIIFGFYTYRRSFSNNTQQTK